MLRTILNRQLPRQMLNSQKLCEKFRILSVDQMTAKIILIEFWKLVEIEKHPLHDWLDNEISKSACKMFTSLKRREI